MNMRSAILAVALLAAVPAALAARAGPLSETGRSLLQTGQLTCSALGFYKPTTTNSPSKCCYGGKVSGAKSATTYATPFCPNSACPGSDLGENLENCGKGTLENKGSCPTAGWTCVIPSATSGTTCTPGKDVHCLGKVSCGGCSLQGSICLIDGTSKSARRCSGAPKPTISLAAVVPSDVPGTPVTITSVVQKMPAVRAACTVNVYRSCDTPTASSSPVATYTFNANYDATTTTDVHEDAGELAAAGNFLVTLACDYYVKQVVDATSTVEVFSGTLTSSATYSRSSTPSVSITAEPESGDVGTATTVTVGYADKDACTRLECTVTVTLDGGSNLIPGWTFTVAAGDASSNSAVSTATSATYAALSDTAGTYTATVTCNAFRGTSSAASSTPSADDTYTRTEPEEPPVNFGLPPAPITSVYCEDDATDATAQSEMDNSDDGNGDYLYAPRVAVFSGDSIQYACSAVTAQDSDWTITGRTVSFPDPVAQDDVLSAAVTVPALEDGTDVSDMDGTCTVDYAVIADLECTDPNPSDSENPCVSSATRAVKLKVFRPPTVTDPTWTDGDSVYTGAATIPTCTATASDAAVTTTPSGEFDATVTDANDVEVTDLTDAGTYTASCSITYGFVADDITGVDYKRACSPRTVSASTRSITVVPLPVLDVEFYNPTTWTPVSTVTEGSTGLVACAKVTQSLTNQLTDLSITISVTAPTGSSIADDSTTLTTFLSSVTGENAPTLCVLGTDGDGWKSCSVCASVPDAYIQDQAALVAEAAGTTTGSLSTLITSDTDELSVTDVCAHTISITASGTDILVNEHAAWTTDALTVTVSFTDPGMYDDHVVVASLLKHQTGGNPWVAVAGSEQTVSTDGTGSADRTATFSWTGLDGKFKIDISITDPARGTACTCGNSAVNNGKCTGRARRNSRNKWHVTSNLGNVPSSVFPTASALQGSKNGLCAKLKLLVPTTAGAGAKPIRIECEDNGRWSERVNNFQFETRSTVWDIVWVDTNISPYPASGSSEGVYRITGHGVGVLDDNGGQNTTEVVNFAIHAIDNRDRYDRFFLAVWPASQGEAPQTFYFKNNFAVTLEQSGAVWGSAFDYDVTKLIANDVDYLATKDALLPIVMKQTTGANKVWTYEEGGSAAGVFVGNNGGQGPVQIGN